MRDASRATRSMRWWGPLLIFAVGTAAYVNSLWGVFAFDDYIAIHENPHVKRLWPIWRAAWAPPDNPVEARPVASLTLAVNYAISGERPWSYHVVNIAVHLLAGLTLLGVLRRTFELPEVRRRVGDAGPWLALAIALVWIVHPLHTECVTYIVVRTELLMGLFFLLTLYCTIRGATTVAWAVPTGSEAKLGRESRSPALRGRMQQPTLTPAAAGRRWYLAAVAACILGMASKEVMAGAPLLVLLYDRVFLAGSFRRAWQQRWPLYLGVAATWVVLAVLVFARPRSGSVGLGLGLTPWTYALTQSKVIVHYLRLTLWPHPLALCYDDWPHAGALVQVWPYVLAIAALLGGTVWALWRKPWLGFLGAWFFVILAPTSSFLPIATEVVGERRMYLPSIAVIVLVIVGVWAGLRWVGRHAAQFGRVRAGVSVALLVLTVGAAAAATIRRNAEYGSEERLWQDTLEKRPGSAWARIWLATVWQRDGRAAEGLSLLEEAVRIAPGMAKAHGNLADGFQILGRPAEALPYYEQALQLTPSDFKMRANYGRALRLVGRNADARRELRQALDLRPDDALTHYQLGQLDETEGLTQQAIAQYVACLRYDPQNAAVHGALGALLGKHGQIRDAMAHLAEAVRLAPTLAQPHMDFAYLYLQEGDLRQAQESAQTATHLAPDRADAQYVLGLVLQQQGREAESAAAYRRAIELKPDFAEVANNLGWILATASDEAVRQPDEAVALAQRAVDLSESKDAGHLDTLAAAYAASGRFEEAVATGEKAANLARTRGQDALARSIEGRLALYRDRRAYVECVPR